MSWIVFGGLGVIFLLLTVSLWASLRSRMDAPSQALAGGTGVERLAERQDAIGRIAQQVQNLKAGLEQKTLQLETQRRNFNAAIALAESIDVSLTTEKVLQLSMPRVLEVTGFYSVAMRIFEPDQKQFRLVAQTHMTASMVEALHVLPQEVGFTGDVYRTHRAAYTSDLPHDPRLENTTPVEDGFRSLISVSFLSGDRLMGTMELGSKAAYQFSEEEVRWLELMGRSIGMVRHQIEAGARGWSGGLTRKPFPERGG